MRYESWPDEIRRIESLYETFDEKLSGLQNVYKVRRRQAIEEGATIGYEDDGLFHFIDRIDEYVYIKNNIEMYLEQMNPLYMWYAINTSISKRIVFHEHILSYLLECSQSLMDEVENFRDLDSKGKKRNNGRGLSTKISSLFGFNTIGRGDSISRAEILIDKQIVRKSFGIVMEYRGIKYEGSREEALQRTQGIAIKIFRRNYSLEQIERWLKEPDPLAPPRKGKP